MKVIVGLQNPGAQYEHTRHNIGSVAVRAFGKEMGFPQFVASAACAADISEGVIEGKDVRLLLPATFMNASGSAVKKALVDANLSTGAKGTDNLIVVYDDLDLPIGTFKISYGRGAGGHNGVRSIIERLGTEDFVRVRIGIAPVSLFGTMYRPSGERVSPFVLKKFSTREQKKVESVFPDIVRAIEAVITTGKDVAMNQYN